MKIGFLFPGQGSQTLGMCKDLYDKYDVVKDTYKKVKDLTGVDVENITFGENADELNQTKNTQICIITMSLAILKILEENGIKAEASCGLSLGEYSALIYSRAISFEEGVCLVKKRGEYMQNLLPKGEWLMAAILGMSEEKVLEVCSKVKSGFVVPVNYNSSEQIVISGEKAGVEEAEIIAKELGAKKVRVLNTSGPFHTEKLIEASKAMEKELENIKINKFESKVLKNIDGKVYKDEDDVKSILAKHIISPVKFSKSLDEMVDMGIDTFIEIGPGKTLSGFAKRIKTEKQLNILNINNVQTLENTIKFIKEGVIKNG